jgi:hypothetical protein
VFQLDLSATQLLLQQGADPNAACVGGVTPAMLLCLLHCYWNLTGPAAELSLPPVLHEHLEAWRDDLLDEPDDATSKPILQVLLSHGARVDLLYPGGYDMLEAASLGYASALMEVLLGVEPFRSMKEGTWSSSSSSSSQPGDQQPGDAGIDNSDLTVITSSSSGAGGGSTACVVAQPSSSSVCKPGPFVNTSAVLCRTVPLDRCSHLLRYSVADMDGVAVPCLDILELGWQPELHPADAGQALLISCKKVRRWHASLGS